MTTILDILNIPKGEDGGYILEHNFGANLKNVAPMFSNFLTINKDNVSKILTVLVPFLMNILTIQKD